MKAINDLISSATIYRARTVVNNPLVGRRQSAGVEDVVVAMPGLFGVYYVWTKVSNLVNE